MEYRNREITYRIFFLSNSKGGRQTSFVAALLCPEPLHTNEALDNADANANQRQTHEEQQQRIITNHGNDLTGPTHGSGEQITDHLNESRDGETSRFSMTATLLSQ